ncbi:unnamed protein product, partial [Allacma fusca]
INPHFVSEVVRKDDNKDPRDCRESGAGSRATAVSLTEEVPVPGGRTESSHKNNHKNRLRNETLSGLNHVDIIANDKSYPISSSAGPVVSCPLIILCISYVWM